MSSSITKIKPPNGTLLLISPNIEYSSSRDGNKNELIIKPIIENLIII